MEWGIVEELTVIDRSMCIQTQKGLGSRLVMLLSAEHHSALNGYQNIL